MKTAAAKLKWFQFRERIIDWQTKRRENHLAVIDRARERSISILQKRYGYTREQAASELKKHYSKARLG
jgi:hypothetical protein